MKEFDYILNQIKTEDFKFESTFINSSKEMFKSLIYEVNTKSKDYIVEGILFPRELLALWYISFGQMFKDTKDNITISDDYEDIWSFIVTIAKDFTDSLYKQIVTENELEPISSNISIFFNLQKGTIYMGKLSLYMVSFMLGIDTEDFNTEDLAVLHQYFSNSIYNKLDFNDVMKMITI